jgi:serralysin
VAVPAYATFHLWKFDEVFSNADGSVQFIEMMDASNGENLVGGKQLKSSTNTFTVPTNLPSSTTANHHMLFATAGFGALGGGVTPDYVIPAHFFNTAGDTLNWAGGFDIKTFGTVPTDGIHSLLIPAGTSATNSPTDFAGSSGIVNLAPPMPTGDYNHDGVVDAADYTVWRDSLGSTTHLAADGNGNGIIDADDYTVWTSHFAQTAGSGSFTKGSVPEPATLVLLLVGMLAFVVSPKPALAIQPSQPVHRDDVPGHRAGNDRVAGSLVDREVTLTFATALHTVERRAKSLLQRSIWGRLH